MSFHARRAVVALGGNAISRSGEEGTVEQDYHNLDESLEQVVDLLGMGYQVVLTHGNGPQVGYQMIRVELARHEAPVLPLDIMGADIQGGLGYMIERVLRGKLRRRGLMSHVACMLMMVEVDPHDAAFDDPSKFVGPFYDEKDVARLERDRGWILKKDANRGWRRVVPSPRPINIVQKHEVLTLLQGESMVITGGGGGIPVTRESTGDVVGVECVVDKDRSSAILALAIQAPELFLLTGVACVQLDYGTPQARDLHQLRVSEARRYLAAGQFPPGSMGPKMQAACEFIERGGGRVLITDPEHLRAALAGDAGTWIVA
jgi:carbamate kinase